MTTPSRPPSFATRLRLAATNMLLPFHSALLLAYFALRALGLDPGSFVTATSYLLVWVFALALPLAPLAWAHPWRPLRWWPLLPAALFLLNYGPRFLPKSSAPSPAAFTVATYNVYWRNFDYPRIIETIEELDADIVALQEVEDPLAAVLGTQLRAHYPYQVRAPEQMILSRYPILEHQPVTLGGHSSARAQRAVIDIQGQAVVVYNAHPRAPRLLTTPLPGLHRRVIIGLDTQDSARDLQDLSRMLRAEKGPLIVLGDLNVTDQHVQYAAVRGDLSDAFLAAGWGLGLTFTQSRRLKIPSWRLDYVLHSAQLRAVEAWLGDFGGSDHRPVAAALSFVP